MTSKMSWISALVFIVIIKTSLSLEFCDSFVKNEYKISYPYRQIGPKDIESYSYIFIGQHYWPLIYLDDTNDTLKKVELMAANGKPSNWFGDDYLMAFCLWRDNKCKAGAVRKDRNVIEWVDVNQSLNKTTPTPTQSQLKFVNKGVKFAYVPTHNQQKGELIIFISPNNPQEKRREFHRVSKDLNITSMTYIEFKESELWKKEDIWEVDPHVFEKVGVFENLIGVLSQYSPADFPKRPSSGEWERLGQGLILLFKNYKSIKYCFTYIRENITGIDSRCKGSALKLLIDCSKHEIKTKTNATAVTTTFATINGNQMTIETTTSQTDARGSGLWLTIILIILVLIVIIVIALILWYVFSRMGKSSPEAEANPISGAQSSVAPMQTARSALQSKVKT